MKRTKDKKISKPTSTRRRPITACILGKYKSVVDESIREVLDNKYIILKKLGFGYFSTVWLSYNIKDKNLYALKIMKAGAHFERVGLDEEALNRVIADNFDSPVWVKTQQ